MIQAATRCRTCSFALQDAALHHRASPWPPCQQKRMVGVRVISSIPCVAWRIGKQKFADGTSASARSNSSSTWIQMSMSLHKQTDAIDIWTVGNALMKCFGRRTELAGIVASMSCLNFTSERCPGTNGTHDWPPDVGILSFRSLGPAWNVCSSSSPCTFWGEPRTVYCRQLTGFVTQESQEVLEIAAQAQANTLHDIQWRVKLQAVDAQFLALLQLTAKERNIKGKQVTVHWIHLPAQPIPNAQRTGQSWGCGNENSWTEATLASAKPERSELTVQRLPYQIVVPALTVAHLTQRRFQLHG